MIVTTEAIILKTMRYGESSRILTIYSREFGKLSVVAKGARDSKNRMGSATQCFNHVQCVIYRKPSRDLHLLSQCDLVVPYYRVAEDLDRLEAAMAVIELVNAVSQGEEKNEPLFFLLRQTLEIINAATKNSQNALCFFEIRLSDILGFKPHFVTCLGCKVELSDRTVDYRGAGWEFRRGGLMCSACCDSALVGKKISLPALKAMQHLQVITNYDAITLLALSPAARKEIEESMRGYLRTHVDGMRNSRAKRVFAELT